jgi:hypothetical protein
MFNQDLNTSEEITSQIEWLTDTSVEDINEEFCFDNDITDLAEGVDQADITAMIVELEKALDLSDSAFRTHHRG